MQPTVRAHKCWLVPLGWDLILGVRGFAQETVPIDRNTGLGVSNKGVITNFLIVVRRM